MTRIAIIDGHPDPGRSHFVHALADAYAEGAGAAHEVRRIEVAALDFPLIRDSGGWETGDIPVPPDIAAAQETIRWAEHVVILYPLWLGTMPALLKGFFEQLLRPHFAYEPAEQGFPKMLLKGRSARIVVTMGMPAPIYRWYFRAHGLKNLKRNILNFIGFKPVRCSIVGGVAMGDKHRRRWLERIWDLGRAGR